VSAGTGDTVVALIDEDVTVRATAKHVEAYAARALG